MKSRLFALSWLLVRFFGRYALHGLLSFVLPPPLEQARRRRVHRRAARTFCQTALSLRGILIKVGQFLSVRIDILPDEFTEELSQLQDHVPPIPYSVIRQRIRQELGEDPERVFAHFSPIPLASASLGQVHQAVLPDGQRVAVKVQYPGIERVVETDLKVLGWATRLLQWWSPSIRFDVLYREFSSILHDELDYQHEARAAEIFRANFAEDPRIVIPRTYWQYTTAHVLTLEFLEGIKITNVGELEAKGVDLKALAQLLVEAYMVQLLRHRIFHGDPHPGNLFVQPRPEGPRLAFVDFGIVQPMDDALYRGIEETMRAIIDRDIPNIVRGLEDLGLIVRTRRSRDAERAVAYLLDEYRDRSPRELRQLTFDDLAHQIRELFHLYPYVQLPNHFVILGRTAGMLSGLNARLDPDLNLIELAAPHIKAFYYAEQEPSEILVDKGLTWVASMAKLPKVISRHLAAVERGEIRSSIDIEELQPMFQRMYTLLLRGMLAMLAVLAFGMWIWLGDRENTPVVDILGGVAAFAAVALGFSLIRSLWRE